MKRKILLVEDHRLMREGFKALIKDQTDLEVIGEADNGMAAIDLAAKLQPHVIMMDIELRGSEMTGVQATRKIAALHKNIKILALSQSDDGPSIKGMMAAGASGYLSKGCTTEELQEAIDTVMQGKPYFGMEIRATVDDEFVHFTRQTTAHHPNDLSDREVEIVRLLTLGQNAKTIADHLRISPKTVAAHHRKIYQKLNIDNLADLTKYALREKIIQANE